MKPYSLLSLGANKVKFSVQIGASLLICLLHAIELTICLGYVICSKHATMIIILTIITRVFQGDNLQIVNPGSHWVVLVLRNAVQF